MSVHQFRVEVAKDYGIDAACVLWALDHWIQHNEANGKNEREGTFWTYNSAKAWAKLMPYFTPKQIRRILDDLEAKELIRKSNFNENTYDRTLWYALTEKGKCICRNGQMEVPVEEDGIPDPVFSVDQCKPSKETKGSQAAEKSAAEEVETPAILCTPAFGVKWEEWLEYRRKEKRQPVGPKLQKRQLEKLATFGEAGARQSLEEAMTAGWTGFFPPKKTRPTFQGKTGGTFGTEQYTEDPFAETRRVTA